jgi:ABC-type sugar transport system permease subunit
MRQRVWTAYLLLLPALICLAVFRLYPIAAALIGSLVTDSLTEPGSQIFVGLRNYLQLFADPIFWQSLWSRLN